MSLNDYGVAEMQQHEMVETDGGFLPLVVAGVCAAVVLLNSCTNSNSVQVNTGDGYNRNGTSASADSTANGNDVSAKVK